MVHMTRERCFEAVYSWDEDPTLEKVPQPHGGWLRRGGKPGNRGGGRPKSIAKRLAGENVEEMLERLIEEFYGDPVRCPGCGASVMAARRITVAQKARIVEVVAKIALSERKNQRERVDRDSFVVKLIPGPMQAAAIEDSIEEDM